MNHIMRYLLPAILMLCSLSAQAQALFFDTANVSAVAATQAEIMRKIAEARAKASADSARRAIRSIDELYTYIDSADVSEHNEYVYQKALPAYALAPLVYSDYIWVDTTANFHADYSGKPAFRWIEEQQAMSRKLRNMQRKMFFEHPELVKYNINMLPEAPKRYFAVVDPTAHTIQMEEVTVTPGKTTMSSLKVKKKHWISTFNASLQFSQAFISPNWYQGGNNNVNALGNVYYNVKLNPVYHPKVLFETTALYKLGLNNAPDDSIHNYSISEDLLQVNTTLGVKAIRHWYYSLTGQFKTQCLRSYPTNSTKLRTAFLAPGELNVGLGMTYNYSNKKKTLSFDASIAPLSYALRMCLNPDVDPTLYNIPAGERFSNKYGSSAELKTMWKITYNIIYTGRIFTFTDYTNTQIDFENKFSFEVNRFLTTQLYWHLRYDSHTPPSRDPAWKNLQMKEILSMGFAYKFSSL